MSCLKPAATMRSFCRAAATSVLNTRLLRPIAVMPASISCSVVSSVLPSMVIDRPPSIARLTAFGIRGSARTVRPDSVLSTASLRLGTHWAWTGRLDVMASPSITLNDGNAIPQVGLGVFQTPPEETERAVTTALEAGYRHVDTAAAYRNESGVGRAIKNAAASGLPREDVYITTKLWNADQGYDSTLRAFDASMDRLGIDYLDLYLIHWPLPERNTFVETFKAFANLRDQGRIRSIGVSNFEPEHLRILVDATGIVPAVNQVELHPMLQQQELREVHATLGVATEAWAPLGQGALLDNPTVTSVAEHYGKTPAQVLIRWHIQLGNIVIPKSVTPERIVSNFDVFDLELSEQDMASISSLGDGTRLGPDPRTFDFTG